MAGERIYIGTSGWNYPHWGKGVFYPSGMRQEQWLPYYTGFFNTVEINNTFYRVPSISLCERWERLVPAQFRFTVKVNRFITHMKRLTSPEQTLPGFLEHLAMLGKKLSLLLFQLPPRFTIDLTRLSRLLDYVRQQTIIPGIRVVLEFRDRSWLDDQETAHLLERERAGLCFSDWPGLNVGQPVTADVVYLRRHGPQAALRPGYSPDEIARDAERMRVWAQEGKEVYAYFNNDAGGFAVKDALCLKKMLKR